jgi:hypothetical protein
MVLFFMELSTRRVQLDGITSLANGLWMAQIARNFTDGEDGFFNKKRYLIYDRDPLGGCARQNDPNFTRIAKGTLETLPLRDFADCT